MLPACLECQASNQFNYTDQIVLMNCTLLPVILCIKDISWECVLCFIPVSRVQAQGLEERVDPTNTTHRAPATCNYWEDPGVSRAFFTSRGLLPWFTALENINMTEHESINNPIRPDVCIPVPTHQLFLTSARRIGRREKPFQELKEFGTLHLMFEENQFSYTCPAKTPAKRAAD